MTDLYPNVEKFEFYPTVNIDDEQLADLLEQWKFDYNWHRPHSSLGGKTPLEKVCELSSKTPLTEETQAKLQSPVKELIQERNYKVKR